MYLLKEDSKAIGEIMDEVNNNRLRVWSVVYDRRGTCPARRFAEKLHAVFLMPEFGYITSHHVTIDIYKWDLKCYNFSDTK